MTEIAVSQIVLYLSIIILFVVPLGHYMSRVFEGKTQFFNVIEKNIYRFCKIDSSIEMNWKIYLSAMLIFNLFGFFCLYLIQRLQLFLPFNPQHFTSVNPELAFNTAISFTTNTDWQAYAGENSLSYFTQMFALTVQNFLSAATGMALLVAFIRGFVRHEQSSLGNFWVDITRSIIYILLPLSIIFAIFLSSQGVIQNFKAYEKIELMQPFVYQDNTNTLHVTEQQIPMGPVASQIAIKQLGSNGGGFFNGNSAHPFENPNPLTNFFEMIAILLIPAALCYSFGIMVKDKRQGWAIFLAMLIIFVPLAFGSVAIEQKGNPAFAQFNIDQLAIPKSFAGGNMEGKETRFGITNSALWSAATCATANGSTNASIDSFTPFGVLVSLWLMHLGETIFGGVGTGLNNMLIMVIITVFVAGLMVGRTPEYLGKKIEPYEMKMASVSVLIVPLIVLLFTAISAVSPLGRNVITDPGPHGFTEMLYAFTSLVNNNGNQLLGLDANTPFYNLCGGLSMLIGRFWFAIPALAIAGSVVRKKIVPNSAGTLATHTPLFIILLISIIVILGALTFLPALALGPIVEQLMIWKQYGY